MKRFVISDLKLIRHKLAVYIQMRHKPVQVVYAGNSSVAILLFGQSKKVSQPSPPTMRRKPIRFSGRDQVAAQLIPPVTKVCVLVIMKGRASTETPTRMRVMDAANLPVSPLFTPLSKFTPRQIPEMRKIRNMTRFR